MVKLIEDNDYGLVSSASGVINVSGTGPDGFPTSGVTLRNRFIGALGRFGGHLHFAEATVQGSIWFGIYVHTNAVVQLSNGNVITGNRIGLEARKNTTVSLGDVNDITGNQTGLKCSPDTAYHLSGAAPSIEGNGVNVDGCLSF